MTTTRRMIIAATASSMAMPTLVQARQGVRWRCATSWGKNLLGPGISAQRLARRVGEMSDGAFRIEIFAAGEIVPALQVFDAVSNGTVEMAHSASLFWRGKMPAAPIFTTVPFGLDPLAHAAWIDGEGQALWDELYAPFGVRAVLAGNTGPSSAGWFRKEIRSPEAIKGMRIRVTGLGGDVYARLGATPLALSPGETYSALERGVVDAAEFLAPANDLAMGLNRIAPYLAFPGFNKPNGASEAIFNLKAWEALPETFRQILIVACRAEHDHGLTEAFSANAAALQQLASAGVTITALPPEFLSAANRAAGEVLEAIGSANTLAERIITSYRKAEREGRFWRRILAVGAPQL